MSAGLPPVTVHEHRMDIIRKVAVGFAVAIPILLGGTSVYAYSSPSVTESHVLYPVRRGIEAVQLRLQFSPESLAAYHLDMYERRLQEAEQLVQEQQLLVRTLQDAAREDAVVPTITSTVEREEMRQKFLERLRNSQRRYETIRLRVYTNVDEDENESSSR